VISAINFFLAKAQLADRALGFFLWGKSGSPKDDFSVRKTISGAVHCSGCHLANFLSSGLSDFRTSSRFPTQALAISNIIPTLAPLINKIMQEGTVKFFNTTKGFGFITPNGGGQDVFVHTSGLIDEIRENDKVEFEVENGRKGVNAVNVKVV